MIAKKLILKKDLQSGIIAEINLVKREGQYEAAHYMDGKYVGGPSIPRLLSPAKGEITHWMGNRPTIGLTKSEAERIDEEVEGENEVIRYRQKIGWSE